MFAAYLAISVITILVNAGAAGADFLRARFVLANSGELDLPESWVAPLGLLKLAGALGVLAGLVGFSWLGIAAATGLVLFFVGAVYVHVRKRVFHNIAVPIGFLTLAVATLVLALVQ